MKKLSEIITTIRSDEKLDSDLFFEIADIRDQLIVDQALKSNNKDVLKAVLRNSLIPKDIIEKYALPISDYTVAILHNDIVLCGGNVYDYLLSSILEKIIEHFDGKSITFQYKDDTLDWKWLFDSIALFFHRRDNSSLGKELGKNIIQLIVMFAESGNSYDCIYAGDDFNGSGCFLGMSEDDINNIISDIDDSKLLKRAYKTNMFYAELILSNPTWNADQLVEIFKGLEDYEGYDIIGIIKNKNTPRDILIKLAENEDEEISELARERL